jgi:hypothetical protein
MNAIMASKPKADRESKIGALRTAVSAAAREAFLALRRNHPHEHFYAFVLFTEPLCGYLIPSANSDEALADDELRWSPPDWRYHGEGERLFVRAQKILDSLDVAGADDDSLVDEVLDAFAGALADLDADNTFGTGSVRATLLINVMWGDQDVVAHLQTAKRLNPRAAFVRYARDERRTLKRMVAEMARHGGGPRLRTAKALLATMSATRRRRAVTESV